MIAMPTSVCYSKPMKKLGGLLGLFGVAALSIYLFADELLLFIMIGKIPFTDTVIPSNGMLILWALIIPISILIWRLGRLIFWSLLEWIGAIHQRQLNQHIRLFLPPLIRRYER